MSVSKRVSYLGLMLALEAIALLLSTSIHTVEIMYVCILHTVMLQAVCCKLELRERLIYILGTVLVNVIVGDVIYIPQLIIYSIYVMIIYKYANWKHVIPLCVSCTVVMIINSALTNEIVGASIFQLLYREESLLRWIAILMYLVQGIVYTIQNIVIFNAINTSIWRWSK